ncbi:MAG: LysE family transporter [Alphaproteobacteria bacterium]
MESWLAVLLKGMGLGLAVAAPIGPINVLCIQRTLLLGFGSGLATALGCASADASYAAVAAFGLSAVSGLLLDNQDLLRLAGGLMLLWLGVRAFVKGPAAAAANPSGGGARLADALSAYGLTIANPLTILTFVAILGGVGLQSLAESALPAALALVLGVFLGTMTWMIFIATLASLARRRAGDRFLLWANRAGGTIILGFAAWLLIGLEVA